jgi:hypothetical protein
VVVFIAMVIRCPRRLRPRERTFLEGMMHAMRRRIENEKEQSRGEAAADCGASIKGHSVGQGQHGTQP